MRWLAWGLAAACSGVPAAAAPLVPEPPLHLYTEEYPPITFSVDDKAAGLGTEVVREILRRAGLTATIEVVPWARGYRYATTLPRVGLFVTTRTTEREPLFKWVGPISATRAYFYSLRGAHVRLKSLTEARDLESVVVPREWYLHQMLRGQGFDNLHPVASPLEAIRMLVGGRTPVIALDDITLESTSRQANVKAAALEPVLPITEALQFLAFSLDTPDEVVQRCQKALDEMRADGTYASLYEHWLPGVVPPAVR